LLARKFSPILLYVKGEKYWPMSIDDLFDRIGGFGIVDFQQPVTIFDKAYAKTESIPLRSAKEFMAYNGHSEYVFSVSDSYKSTNFSEIFGSSDRATVYYSYFEDGLKFYINYLAPISRLI
jgi:hypothetical protein